MMLKLSRPVAITMWDFSWLERRWPGGGYEDWGRALDELAERGYDAVRIDAYPHLISWAAGEESELLPTWHFLDWGSPMKCDVGPLPALTEFIAACASREIRVGLSSWFREDRRNLRMRITDPSVHARIWVETLDVIRGAGLLDSILFVDLCNEWPGDRWAPFFVNDPPTDAWNGNTEKSRDWMKRAAAIVRREYPGIPLTFSFWPDVFAEEPADNSYLDFFEPHIWLSQQGGFYRHVGYSFEPFDIKGMENVAAHAAAVYQSGKAHWLELLAAAIDRHAFYSGRTGRGLVTTECWGPVDYKDGPRLDWGWVKECCEFGVERAAASGRWLGIATSNFCGPQFCGMWRDVGWHQRLTSLIKAAVPADELRP